MFSDVLKKTLDTLVLTMSLQTMCFSLVELGLELMGSGASRKPQRLQTRTGRNVEGLIFKKHQNLFLEMKIGAPPTKWMRMMSNDVM